MDVSDVKGAIADVLPTVRAYDDDADRARRLADEVVGALRRTGINRLLLPVELGGMDAPVVDTIDIVEQLATADGSTAWCAVIGTGSNLFAGYLPPDGARRVFADRDAAFANYHAKPPMNAFDPDALHAYVDHGFRSLPDGNVELKCSPETEARVFEAGPDNGAFAGLGRVACPTTVAASGDGAPPAQMASLVADSLPQGSLRRFPELTHFGPMEDPAGIATAISLDFVAFS